RENSLIPLPRLFALDTQSKEYNEGHERGIFYSESWALVHYLLLGNENRREQALRYFDGLTRGEDGPEAFRRAFNTDEATLEKELREYVRRRRFKYTSITVEPETALQINSEPLAGYETLTLLGNLLVIEGPEQAKAAEEHFQAALAEKPGYGP